MEIDKISKTADATPADKAMPTDFSKLSHDELVDTASALAKRLDELEKTVAEQAKIIEGFKPPQNDWHSWFYILLNIVLHKFKKDQVKILREVVLGAMPPRADFIVVEEGDIIDLGLDVFKFFLKYNIIEFKSPDDELTSFVLWKVVGYAGFYIDHDKVSSDEVTLTLFRGAKPVKLLEELKGYVKNGPAKGIYTIEGWKVDFPIQIVVTTELEGEEYAAFRTISKKPAIDDIRLVMEMAEKESDPAIKQFLREYLEMLSNLDNDIVEEVNRRYPDMARTWRDIFGVDDEISTARADERRTNLYIYVQDGDMQLDRAAQRAGMSTADFSNAMANAGYTVPQTVSR